MKENTLAYFLLKSFWNLFSLIPLPVMYFMSDLLFYPFYYVVKYRKKIVRKNLTESFPDKDIDEIRSIERRFYRFFLDFFFETCKYATISKKKFMKRMVFENVEEINRLLQEGKNISLFMGHYGNWEWISSIPLHLKGNNFLAGQIYHRLNSKPIDKLMLQNRGRMGAISIEMKNTLRWINEQFTENIPTITGYIADQSPRKKDVRHYVDFLNHHTPVLTGAEKITRRYHMEAYYLDIIRIKRGYYKAKYIRMDDQPSSLPEMKLTEIYYNYLEKTIHRHPEFYLWTHKRFRYAEMIKKLYLKNYAIMEIDFVITWVDMDDPKWKKSFADCSGKIDNSNNSFSEARFRDHGFLKYWFRGVEKFTPWVRKIHFITCGQKPEWLNDKNPKLHLVNHEDFIPKQFLPSFNSTSIEMHMHKIPGLSDHFVYFNDDFFIINHTGKERFFRNGLPCDIAAFQYHPGISQWEKRIKNNIRLINKHFDKKQVLNRFHDKWYNKIYGKKARLNYLLKYYPKFITLRTPHNAQPYLKSTFESIWAVAEDELMESANHRFRTTEDLTPELFRAWQICEGNFEPYNTYVDTKMFPLFVKSKQAILAVENQSYKLVCLNDNIHIRNYAQVMGNIKNAFQSILPEKSTFEIEQL